MSEKIIGQKFDIWTKNLKPEDARIAIFEHIRDIPYYLVPQIENPYEWAVSVLEADKASCTPKHYLLAILFRRLGIHVKYATYPFKWEAQPIKYPADLKELSIGLPAVYHLACKAYISGKWILVDATWDSALKGRGFPVNEKWDGKSDTLNAALPSEEVLHEQVEDRIKYVAQKKSSWTEEEKTRYALFTKRFNQWLEDLRKTSLL